MLSRPVISDDAIVTAVREAYGIAPAHIAFLPLGNDANAAAFRLNACDGTAYFVKLRRVAVNPASVRVPRYLADHGLPQVVAPLWTRTQQLSTTVGDDALIVYPFVDSTTGYDACMSLAQWTAYGAAVRAIHNSALPGDLAALLPRESFAPDAGCLHALKTQPSSRSISKADRHTHALAEFWHTHQHDIERIVARAELLGCRLHTQHLPMVLCHADIHLFNILIDRRGELRVVDWDGPMFAPKERDLKFVYENTVADFVVDAEKQAAFFRGYGDVTVDPLALAYYRYEWVAQDLGDYALRVFNMPDLDDTARADAVAGFISMFDAGNVVDLAERTWKDEWMSK